MTTPESPSSDALRVAIDNYRESIAAYLRFLTTIHPVLDTLPGKTAQDMTGRLGAIVDEFRKEASRAELKQLALVIGAVIKQAGRPGTEGATEDPAEEDLTDQRVLPRVGVALDHISALLKASVNAHRHHEILYRSVLTGLVGQFEVLVSDLAHHFYRRAPGALGSSDKSLSIAELLSFSSIDEALEHVIADKIDDLIRGSADDWAKFFGSRLKIDITALAIDWPRFVEYIQRRHLIVHAGSRISRRYIKNVDAALQKEYFGKPQLGMPVHMTVNYINAAVEAFEVLGLLLGFASWVKLHEGRAADQATVLDKYLYESMFERKWIVAMQLSRWGLAQDSLDAATRLRCHMNYWLSLKRLGRFSECKADVEAFDSSATKVVFAIAQAALLEQNDRFFELVEEDEGASFDTRAWTQWPIFEEVRKDSRFEELRTRFAATSEDSQGEAATHEPTSAQSEAKPDENGAVIRLLPPAG